ncbi:hypothetical protein BDY21DRAFT_20418 [Lineolata rhizophorae]|uniref:Uncharacterized protein n=1 Tax=Lineolata rhizophorae TaxID=578093 RepID=A0A6A6P1Y9_9PEZI|nr:hypothetical protein BDY21DRAFT_20418 [Lineolata rhizophorae]
MSTILFAKNNLRPYYHQVCRGDKSDYERLEALDEVFAPSPNSSPPPPVPPLPAEIQDKRSLGPSFVPPPTPTSYSTPRASVEEGDSGEVPLGLPMPRQRPQIPKSRLSEFVVNDAALPDWAAYKAEATKEDDTAKEQDRQAEDQPSTPASSSSKSSRPPLSRLARELVAERDASEKFGSGSPRQDNDSVGSASSGRPLLQTSPPAPAQPTRTPPKSIIKSRSRIFRRFETSSDDQESLSPESLRAPPPIPPKSPLRAPRRHRSFFNLRGAAASAENVPPVPPLPSQIPPPIRPLPPIPAAPVQTAPARPPPPPPEQRPLMRVQTPIVTGLDSVPQRPRGPIPPPLPLPGPNEPLPPHLVGHPALLSQHLGATMEQARPTTALSSPSDHPGPPVGPHRHVRTHAVSGSADLSPEDLLAHATRRGKFPDGPGADRVRRWI